MNKETNERCDLRALFNKYMNGENPSLWIENGEYIALKPEQACQLKSHTLKVQEGIESYSSFIELLNALKEAREDELDLIDYEKAFKEYEADPITFSHEEVMANLSRHNN